MDYTIMEIDKTNKPESFQELYQCANPLPGARPKVPLLQIITSTSSSSSGTEVEEGEQFLLCESTVISEYVATMESNGSNLLIREKQEKFWPTNPKERAKLRLFMELCGSSFSSYLAFSRVQDMQQLETQYDILQENMKQLDAFLSTCFATHNNKPSHHQFTLAEAHMAPFVQRCCGILPQPYDPITISQNLHLIHVGSWIQTVLSRDSVVVTAPPLEEIQNKRNKLIKRLSRIQVQ